VVLLLSWFVPLASAACPAPTPAAELRGLVDDAALSLATLDEEGFIAATDALRGALPCASEILTPADAASVHRTVALRKFWDGDEGGAREAFQAALRVEPGATLPTKIAPEGGPLARLYADAQGRPPSLMVPFRGPSWTTGHVDGARASDRPANVPAIVQYDVSSEGVVYTELVPSGGGLPDSAEAARARRIQLAGGAAPALAATAGAATSGSSTSGSATSGSSASEKPDDGEVASSGATSGGSTSGSASSGAASGTSTSGGSTSGGSAGTSSGTESSGGATASSGGSNLSGVTDPGPRPDPRPPREPREPRAGGGGKGGWIGATVATGLVAGGLFGLSAATNASFQDDPTQAKFNLTNGAYWGSVGTGALAGTLLVVTIVK
jgi:hypothetical protein